MPVPSWVPSAPTGGRRGQNPPSVARPSSRGVSAAQPTRRRGSHSGRHLVATGGNSPLSPRTPASAPRTPPGVGASLARPLGCGLSPPSFAGRDRPAEAVFQSCRLRGWMALGNLREAQAKWPKPRGEPRLPDGAHGPGRMPCISPRPPRPQHLAVPPGLPRGLPRPPPPPHPPRRRLQGTRPTALSPLPGTATPLRPRRLGESLSPRGHRRGRPHRGRAPSARPRDPRRAPGAAGGARPGSRDAPPPPPASCRRQRGRRHLGPPERDDCGPAPSVGGAVQPRSATMARLAASSGFAPVIVAVAAPPLVRRGCLGLVMTRRCPLGWELRLRLHSQALGVAGALEKDEM